MAAVHIVHHSSYVNTPLTRPSATFSEQKVGSITAVWDKTIKWYRERRHVKAIVYVWTLVLQRWLDMWVIYSAFTKIIDYNRENPIELSITHYWRHLTRDWPERANALKSLCLCLMSMSYAKSTRHLPLPVLDISDSISYVLCIRVKGDLACTCWMNYITEYWTWCRYDNWP